MAKENKNVRQSFASDNNSGVHPKIMRAVEKANAGHCVAYGDDPWTALAVDALKGAFGKSAHPFVVLNGTGANVTLLASMTQPHQAIFCAESAHIYTDECNAIERFIGCKMVPLPSPDGKIRTEDMESRLHWTGDEHHPQPKVVSITQATETGVVYTVDEIKALAAFARRRGMFLHMDGARLSNAAAALGVSLKAMTADAGAHAVSFGGTKNGMMGGEAAILFDPALAADFKYIRKQGMQLNSKMRYMSAQFEAYLAGDLWLKNARSANRAARRLADGLKKIPQIEIVYPVETNAIFAAVPRRIIKPLLKEFFFYVWDEQKSVVRWMTSFDTTAESIDAFLAAIRKQIGG